MSRRVDPPGIAALLRSQSDDIRALKRGPGRWIYVGFYPDDDNTTPESPPFENGWGNSAITGLPDVSFHIDKWRNVQIRGAASGGEVGSVIFTLPLEYRPGSSERFVCAGDETFVILQVDPDGAVTRIL